MQKTKIHIARKSQNIVEYFFFFFSRRNKFMEARSGHGHRYTKRVNLSKYNFLNNILWK